MRILRTLTPGELSALKPLFGTTADGGFIQLRGSSRQFVNPETGQLITRREYDKTYGTIKEYGSYERKLKERQEKGISRPNPRRVREQEYKKAGRKHYRFNLGREPLGKKFQQTLPQLRKRFGTGGHPGIYILLQATTEDELSNDEPKVTEHQTRIINAFNDSDIDILRDDIEAIKKKYKIIIIASYLVWVHDIKK